MVSKLLIALGFLLIIVTITSCQSSGLGKTCERFGMTTEYVDVIAVDHEVLDKAYTQTRFKCVPKTRYKSGR